MLEVSGVNFGKFSVDKETGRTKVSQVVEGVNVGQYLEDLKAAKMYSVDKQRDTIEANTKKIAALEEFKQRSINLGNKVSVLANRLSQTVTIYGSKSAIPNAMKNVMATATVNGFPADSLAQFSLYEGAEVGAFDMVVNQVAKADSYQGRVVVENANTPMGLSGTFTIGTTTPDSKVEFMITPEMTLQDIKAAINTQSETTGVSANYSMISASTALTSGVYEFSLKANDVSDPIILQDDNNILTRWNLIPNNSVSVESGPSSIAADPGVALPITGNLVVGSSSGATATIDTTGLSLQGVIDQINAQTGATNVTANLRPIYPANAMSDTLPIGYGLSLSTTDNQPLNLANSDLMTLSELKLTDTVNSSTHSIVNSANPAQDQELTGNLVLQAGPGGIPVTIDTAGKSLDDIVSEINQNSSTIGVFAKLQIIHPGKVGDPERMNVCQLTFSTTNGTSLITSGTDAAVATGLGLGSPVNDYQSMISKLSINGTDYERPSKMIEDILTGVTINLRSADPDKTINVSVEQNTFAAEEAWDAVITAYNELNSFFNVQTAMVYDSRGVPLEPKEGAYLYDETYVKDFARNLRSIFSSIVGGPENNNLYSLGSIGFALHHSKEMGDDSEGEAGRLVLVDEEKYRAAVDKNYDKLVALFENTISNTNANFCYVTAPHIIDEQFSGKPITISLREDSGGFIGNINVNGTDYSTTATETNGIYKIKVQTTGTCLDEFTFFYTGTPPTASQTVSTKLTVTSGIMSKVDAFLIKATDPEKHEGKHFSAPFNIKGSMLQNIEIVKMKNKNLVEDTEQKKKAIEREMESVERKFDKVYAAKERYDQVKSMLNSFIKANSR